MSSLLEFSIFAAKITFDALLSYNNITNDSDSFIFSWNKEKNAKYYLQLNPICDDNELQDLPISLKEFINKTNCCYYPCKMTYPWCPPILYQDGKCDYQCDPCNSDGGDCAQLCFAGDPYSDCTFELFGTDKDPISQKICQRECNNSYCPSHGGPDGNNCGQETKETVTIDPNCRYGYFHVVCRKEWIEDEQCDLSCMSPCNYFDEIDCSLECEGFCEDLYVSWMSGLGSYLTEQEKLTNVHKIQHDIVCEKMWVFLELYLINKYGEVKYDRPCNTTIIKWDFNDDGYLNFKEYIMMMWYFNFNDYYDRDDQKYQQLDCSACTAFYDV